jgi:histidinol-phosphate aminotransferase
VRESFNVNMAGLAAAEASLGDEAHLRRSLASNAGERELLAAALRERGYFVHPSLANFLLVEFGPETPRIEAGLLERGVVLRPMAGYGLPECLRITVGDPGGNRRLLAALDALR